MILSLLLAISQIWFLQYDSSEPTERWLVELKSEDATCLQQWWTLQDLKADVFLKRPLKVGHWWVVQVPARLSTSLQELDCIIDYTIDRPITWRDLQPNDPAYINQSDMNLIGMTRAWDVTTGGLTTLGDTIVVAVVDDGFQTNHEDLATNIWINRGEIPNDGVDNDDNGYTDDFRGLNIGTGNDQHAVLSHGTSVCGIIGAVGNNGKGVAGANWNIKLMLLSGADFESDLIDCYNYALDMRQKYKASNGAEGAFVVVTNMSGGVDGAWAQDHPLWCGMYDALGSEGILSVCAAPNQPISVDTQGDMPTTCPSPYMIAVTNVDASDQLVETAGFGPVSIDLGAPGHGTVTTATTNQYKMFPGTSSSTPHVTGVIALMYSTPCTEFLFELKSNPSALATQIRDIILNTGKLNNTLSEITVT